MKLFFFTMLIGISQMATASDCRKDLLKEGWGIGYSSYCKGVDPSCAKAVIRKGRNLLDLQYCQN